MARILSRPMFRKGGLSKAPRPSYRGGGVTAIRPRYKQGGRMTGIMSGIVPRRGYADGYNWWETPLGQTIKGTGTEARKIGAAVSDFAGVPINALTRFLTGYNPGFSGAKAFGLGEEEGVDPEKAYFFGVPTSAKTGWEIESKQPKEVIGVDSPPSYVPPPDDTPPSEDEKRSIAEDFESVYKDIGPLIEKEMMGRPSTKDKWLALAKFGAGLASQPGGDLVGAIGKAAEKPIDDLSKLLAEERAAKRSAKKIGLTIAAEKYLKDDKVRDTVEGYAKYLPNMKKSDIAKNLLVPAGTENIKLEIKENVKKSFLEANPNNHKGANTYADDITHITAPENKKKFEGINFKKLPKKDGVIKSDKIPEGGGYYYDPDTGEHGFLDKQGNWFTIYDDKFPSLK